MDFCPQRAFDPATRLSTKRMREDSLNRERAAVTFYFLSMNQRKFSVSESVEAEVLRTVLRCVRNI